MSMCQQKEHNYVQKGDIQITKASSLRIPRTGPTFPLKTQWIQKPISTYYPIEHIHQVNCKLVKNQTRNPLLNNSEDRDLIISKTQLRPPIIKQILLILYIENKVNNCYKDATHDLI